MGLGPVEDGHQLVKGLNEGFRPSVQEHVPEAIGHLIEVCMSQEPGDRPSMQEALEFLVSDVAKEIAMFDFPRSSDEFYRQQKKMCCPDPLAAA